MNEFYAQSMSGNKEDIQKKFHLWTMFLYFNDPDEVEKSRQGREAIFFS